MQSFNPDKPGPSKTRGATFNPDNRYAPTRNEAVADGWWQETLIQHPATQVREETSQSALSWNRSPDLPFDRSINPYRGCEHGCIYCYARPTHAYWDLSPGLDFETRLIARTGLLEQLQEELCKPGYQCQPINLSGNTDCYQPLESRYHTTRRILKLLHEYRHPVMLITKSALILKDKDLLARMAEHRLVQVYISLTSLNAELKRTLEPRAASPQARLRVMRELSQLGIPVGVLIAPVIPGLTDHEIERLLQATHLNGATTATWMPLRLPLEVAPLFEDWLQHHYPERASKVINLIRQCHGGKLNEAEFGKRFSGKGAYFNMIAQRFRLALQKYGLQSYHDQALNSSDFRPPRQQGELFDR